MDYSRRGIERRRRQLHAKMPKLTNMLGAGFYMAAIIVLVASVLAGSFAVAGIFRGMLTTAPDISTIDVRPTGYSSSVYDSDGNQMTKLVATNSNRIIHFATIAFYKFVLGNTDKTNTEAEIQKTIDETPKTEE